MCLPTRQAIHGCHFHPGATSRCTHSLLTVQPTSNICCSNKQWSAAAAAHYTTAPPQPGSQAWHALKSHHTTPLHRRTPAGQPAGVGRSGHQRRRGQPLPAVALPQRTGGQRVSGEDCAPRSWAAGSTAAAGTGMSCHVMSQPSITQVVTYMWACGTCGTGWGAPGAAQLDSINRISSSPQ